VSLSSALTYLCDPPANQVAKGIIDSHDALVDLFESIERFISRLDIYSRIPSTPAMNDIVVKILVELLCTLALATKELKQGRSSESILADLLRYSAYPVKALKKVFGQKGNSLKTRLVLPQLRLLRLSTVSSRV
jgi:hypothetical protein